MYCLRNSLEDVGLYDVSAYSLPKSLKEFPKLRSLKIEMIPRLDIICDIGKYTKSCPGFVDLTISHKFRSGVLYGDIDSDVQSIIPCPTVQCLDLGGLPLTKNILQYIMHAFPNINSFHINPVSVFISSVDSYNLWMQFLVYLSKVKNFIEVVKLFIDDLPAFLTEYFNTIIFNGRLKIKHISFASWSRSRPYITYYKYGAHEPTMTVYLSENEQILHLLPKASPFLNTLKCYCNRQEYERHNILLDQIFQQCSSLESLHLSNLSIGNCNPEPQTNTSITDLTLTDCDLLPEFFPELSARLPSLSNLFVDNHHEIAWRSDAFDPSGHPIANPSELPTEIPSELPTAIPSEHPTAILPIEPTLMYTDQSALGYDFGHGNIKYNDLFSRGHYDTLLFRYMFPDTSLNMVPHGSPYGNTNNGSLYLPSIQSRERYKSSHYNYIIKMPSTSFDTLTWERDSAIDISAFLYTSINLKIETTANTKYYYGAENLSITEICEDSYKKNSDIPEVFSMYIQCHDIKNLIITLADHEWII
jgi:hypothetical protein